MGYEDWMDVCRLLSADPKLAHEFPEAFEAGVCAAITPRELAAAICDGFARLAFGSDASDLHVDPPVWRDDTGARAAFAFMAAAGATADGARPQEVHEAIRRAFLGANLPATNWLLVGSPRLTTIMAAVGNAGRRRGLAGGAVAAAAEVAEARTAGEMSLAEAVAAVAILATAPDYIDAGFIAAAERAIKNTSRR